MRHWLFGGRTDLRNLVLLCDRDHGVVHELDLIMSRSDGRLVVTAADGRRVWGPADAAFAGGLAGLEAASVPGQARIAGVDPIGTGPAEDRSSKPPLRARSRRLRRSSPTRTHAGPTPAHPSAASSRPGPHRPRGSNPVRSAARNPRPRVTRPEVPVGATLFPAGEPQLPDAMPTGGERMDVRYVVGVLMGNRDLVRRLAAEAAGVPAGTP
jgi:hypothetical protein